MTRWLSRSPLDRRTFLRGAGAVAIGLPALEAMLGPHGNALATGVPLPDRFGVWFWGNGMKPTQWVPRTTGTGWVAPTELVPLEGLRDYYSLLSGFELKTGDKHPHHAGMTGIMTGEEFYLLAEIGDTVVTTFARQSVDQDAADWFEGSTAFRSLEFGVTKFYGSNEGSTFQHLSHNGPNNPNPSEYDPGAMFERLFGQPADPQLNLVRASVLDLVSSQVSSLQQKLGTGDKIRLEQHLDSIRELEVRISEFTTACDPGTDAPTAVADVDGREQIAEKGAIMADLLALALACDLTRAFSVQWSTCASSLVVWQVGATEGLHQTCHTEPPPQPIVDAATVFTMEQLAVFLQRLRDTPEGDGNLLDRCAIMATSELADGYVHSVDDYPFLLCGKGNGRVRTGVHYRSETLQNTSTMVLTALHGAGVTLPSWGVDEGMVTDVVSDVLT